MREGGRTGEKKKGEKIATDKMEERRRYTGRGKGLRELGLMQE